MTELKGGLMFMSPDGNTDVGMKTVVEFVFALLHVARPKLPPRTSLTPREQAQGLTHHKDLFGLIKRLTGLLNAPSATSGPGAQPDVCLETQTVLDEIEWGIEVMLPEFRVEHALLQKSWDALNQEPLTRHAGRLVPRRVGQK